VSGAERTAQTVIKVFFPSRWGWKKGRRRRRRRKGEREREREREEWLPAHREVLKSVIKVFFRL
jgi:hypothetical protein